MIVIIVILDRARQTGRPPVHAGDDNNQRKIDGETKC